MPPELLDLYRKASVWAIEKVNGAIDLDAATPCDEWNLRTLLDHMLETQQYFAATAEGREAAPPSPNPPAQISDDPAADLSAVRDAIVASYADADVLEQKGFGLGAAAGDFLIHGWDVARASQQDATMPPDVAEGVFNFVYGQFTAENRHGVFKPEIPVAPDADIQTKLLAYAGRAA
ncbi:MAG TPA: TIGR03086 family metal-binding protein [Acidimicrobiales bacterium]|nr:TIGR03086 family metal-binding protein [Acidimicrobiales bacterium]